MRFLPSLLILAAILSPPVLAKASIEADGRYLVHSPSGLLRAIFGVQHEVSGGFTTDAVYGKKTLLKFLSGRWGFEAEPVARYQVRGESFLPGLEQLGQLVGFTQEPAAPPRPEQADQIPWGVKFIYNNPALTQTTGGQGVTVAILDTGVAQNHPDLSSAVAECLSFSNGNLPWPVCADSHGHGTHLAGIIAANAGADSRGIYGLAPAVNLAVYRVCDATGGCWADDIAAGLKYAAEKKVNVALLGFSGPASDLIDEALNRAVKAGVLVVAPAFLNEAGLTEYPAANPAVVAVEAIDKAGRLAADSSFDADFFAPGVDIESTWFDGGYRRLSGSSTAAAHLAGLAAKIWAGTADKTLAELQLLTPPGLPAPRLYEGIEVGK